MSTHTTHSREETLALGRDLTRQLTPGTLVTFQGDLGAGKTTLIQGILAGLGAERPYVSPTFVIMKQYDLPAPATPKALQAGLKTPSRTGIRRVYHADAYRVGAEDFAKLGFAEWLSDPEGLVLLEWPERVADILPKRKISITLKSLSKYAREILVDGDN